MLYFKYGCSSYQANEFHFECWMMSIHNAYTLENQEANQNTSGILEKLQRDNRIPFSGLGSLLDQRLWLK